MFTKNQMYANNETTNIKEFNAHMRTEGNLQISTHTHTHTLRKSIVHGVNRTRVSDTPKIPHTPTTTVLDAMIILNLPTHALYCVNARRCISKARAHIIVGV